MQSESPAVPGPIAAGLDDAAVTAPRLNLLLCSVPFRPSVGGIETVSELLAERFHAFGHKVVLLTQTESEERDHEPFRIVRRPGARELFRWVKWADVVFHNNVSLKLAWPQLVLRRPWLVAHHMWAPRSGEGAVAGRIKHWVCRFASNTAVSRAMAESLDEPATIIPNPYSDNLFTTVADVSRDRELVFLGRLIPDKGAAVLLDALAALAQRGSRARLTVIGSGPDEPALRRRATQLGIAERVAFAGSQRGPALVRMLNAHQVIVVPSIWEEPFGVVALEGLACGCVPLVTRSGGLPDAVGPCGVVVPKNDAAALADAIERLLSEPAARAAFLERAPAHLAQHTRIRIARRYLELIDDVYRRGAGAHASAAATAQQRALDRPGFSPTDRRR